MIKIAGVDEAGRGPLIGDLFMALVVINESVEETLRNLGVRDSKKLTRKKREELFNRIISIAEAIVIARITPVDIDKENINDLEIKTLCRILAKAYSTIKFDKIYVDAFANPNKIVGHLQKCLREPQIDVVAVYNADSAYTIVGAASIVAKVLRDRHIDTLRQVYGDFGSGYPSDKRTIDWLKNYYQNHKAIPSIVRKSWKTVENILGVSSTLDRYTIKKSEE
ncbi:MAG: ribonuclease HII [Ignisphaera sp.]